MIVFRTTDVDVPFFWESDRQPAGRWHGAGEGPAQYTCSTPSAAWAEFLRHQRVSDVADLAGIRRAMWVLEIPDNEPTGRPALPDPVLVGDETSYPACQSEARRLRAAGATRIVAPSAAVLPGTPSGWTSEGELLPGPPRDEATIVLYGARPAVVGWYAATPGFPEPELLDRTRPLAR
ncbi:MAG: RES family NAD+ phosphorylase [Candidatus Limnocylindrales bacterium]